MIVTVYCSHPKAKRKVKSPLFHPMYYWCKQCEAKWMLDSRAPEVSIGYTEDFPVRGEKK